MCTISLQKYDTVKGLRLTEKFSEILDNLIILCHGFNRTFLHLSDRSLHFRYIIWISNLPYLDEINLYNCSF